MMKTAHTFSTSALLLRLFLAALAVAFAAAAAASSAPIVDDQQPHTNPSSAAVGTGSGSLRRPNDLGSSPDKDQQQSRRRGLKKRERMFRAKKGKKGNKEADPCKTLIAKAEQPICKSLQAYFKKNGNLGGVEVEAVILKLVNDAKTIADANEMLPSSSPSVVPTRRPSVRPTSMPSPSPSTEPSTGPSPSPSSRPSDAPTDAPSDTPTGMPSNLPSLGPSHSPTSKPSPWPSTVASSEAPSSPPGEQQCALPCVDYEAFLGAQRCAPLKALYYATGGDGWTSRIGWPTTFTSPKWGDCCSLTSPWDGVFCDEEGNVERINLETNGLVGTIPTEIGSLENLQTLSLQNNEITGTIPTEIGSLENLQYLDLNNNEITGTIPTEIGSLGNLQGLFLNNNQITGNIPTEMGSLENLEDLSLYDTGLFGFIPSSFANLTSLRDFEMRLTSLTGSFPVGFCALFRTGLLERIRYVSSSGADAIVLDYDQCINAIIAYNAD